MAKRLNRAKRAGLVHTQGWNWHPGKDDRKRPFKQGMIPTRGPGTPEFLAYVTEHPGLTRAELQDALHYDDRQTVNNRILASKGRIRQDDEGRIWPAT
jgi:hypothetical protein